MERAELLERIVAWAESEPLVRGAIVIGSGARVDRPADEWSDIDLWLIAEDPAPLIDSGAWCEQIAPVWLTFLERTALGDGVERRVLYAGGHDVDFVVVPRAITEQIIEHGMPPEVAELIRRGIRFLVDKDGYAARMPAAPPAAPPPRPTEHDFLEVVNDLLYHGVWTAKKLRRGELWTAVLCLNGFMAHRLLRMIEWHARSAHGWSYDTWHNGRFIEQWADLWIIKGLRESFAHYDADDLRQALFAMLDLFRWVAHETAARCGFTYPTAADKQVAAWLAQVLDQAPAPAPTEEA